MLGVLWTRKDLEALKKSKDKSKDSKGSTQEQEKRKDVFIPLSYAFNPKLLDGILEQMSGISTGSYAPEKGEEIVEMDREMYSKLYRKRKRDVE